MTLVRMLDDGRPCCTPPKRNFLLARIAHGHDRIPTLGKSPDLRELIWHPSEKSGSEFISVVPCS